MPPIRINGTDKAAQPAGRFFASIRNAINVRNPVRTLVSITSIRHNAVKPARLRMPQSAGAAGSFAETFTRWVGPPLASGAVGTSNAHGGATAPNTVIGT